MKKFLVVFALFCALVVMFGCNKNHQVSYKLQWSNKASDSMPWNDAINYCKNLNEGGHSDWRLPNIDELRTLIKNCPKTESGGECKVSEQGKCLSLKCWQPSSSCSCALKEDNSGYYSKLGDDDNVGLLSSSVVSDDSNRVWYIGFGYAGPTALYNKAISGQVRCVRNAE